MALESSKRAKLRQFLVDHFSFDDLKDLAFDLGVNFEALPHHSTQELARELIAYFEHQAKIDLLIVEAVKQRPDNDIETLFAEFLHAPSGTHSISMHALSSEIRLNLTKLKAFVDKEYRIVDDRICSKDGEGVLMDYFECMTNVFQSGECQTSIASLKEESRSALFQIYGGFQDINAKADALKLAFRPWRASLYLDTVKSFDKNLRPLAEKISQEMHESAFLLDAPASPISPQTSHRTLGESIPYSVLVILFVAADPSDASRLRLGEEFREIQEKLKLAKLRERFILELPQLSVRPADLSQALLDTHPQIVHFSGHGTAKGALCFENRMGQTQLVDPSALAALFEQFAHQVDCVLLNACYSEIQAKAIARHIDYVIGMNEAIGDTAAIAFALGFYQALGAGRTIEEAYKLGCVQIRLEGIPEHLTPVLIKKQQSRSKEQKPLQGEAIFSPDYNAPTILGSVQRHRTEFLPIPLFPGIGNAYLRDNYLDPPLGDVVLAGVKFRLESNPSVFDTSKQTRYYLPRPDGGKEVELQLREPIDHVKAAYLLINSGNSKLIYASEKIGEITLLFKGAPPLVTDLILGDNVREWCVGNPGDWVRETTNPLTQTAWPGMSKGGANAVIDCLKIPVYESMKDCVLEKIIFVHKPTRAPSDELGVHFFVSAISLEIEHQGA